MQCFKECVRVSMKMPPLGCKHGWPFEFFLFVGSMKSNHVWHDRGNGFLLYPVVNSIASKVSALCDCASCLVKMATVKAGFSLQPLWKWSDFKVQPQTWRHSQPTHCLSPFRMDRVDHFGLSKMLKLWSILEGRTFNAQTTDNTFNNQRVDV